MARKGLIGRVSKKRSANMSAIRSKNTKPELLLRKQLTLLGLRYRLHRKDIPGAPDIVFAKAKILVFCDGDFWHGKDWKRKKRNGVFKVRNEYWTNKIEMNIARDKKNTKLLQQLGWTVLRYWASEIQKNPIKISRRIDAKISRKIKGN